MGKCFVHVFGPYFPIPHVLIKGCCASVTHLLRLFSILPLISPTLPSRFELSYFAAECQFVIFYEGSKKFFKDCATKAEGWVHGVLPLPSTPATSMPPVTVTSAGSQKSLTLKQNQDTAPVVATITTKRETAPDTDYTPSR